MPPDPGTQDHPTGFPRMLAAGVGLLCALAAVLGGLTVWRDYATTLARAESTARNTSRLLAQIAGSDIHGVDLALQAAVDELTRQSAEGGPREPEVTAFLGRHQARLPQIVSLRATDAAGIVRYGPGVVEAPRTDLSDREFFQRPRDEANSGLVIAKPVFARISRQWVVPVSRRYDRPDGSFGGVVYANIALEHLGAIFAKLEIGANGVITVLDSELRVFARHPQPPSPAAVIGQTVSSPALRAFVDSGADAQIRHGTGALDGLSRTYGYRHVAPYPLYVSVGLADGDAFGEWRQHCLRIGAVTAAFMATILVLSLALWRAWRHRSQAMERLARTGTDLERALKELRRSNTELESFAYATSHDLRQPLRMVTSFLGLIERRYAERLDDEGREFIAYAVNGARRMDSLILGLLEYSRIGRGAEAAPVDLGGAVAEALANLQPAITEAQAEIRVAQDLPTVTGNALEMMRLFQNLVGNAIKYRHPDRTPQVEIGLRPDPVHWIVIVADNGVGIPPQDAERVFGLFQRLVTDADSEGTGLGLAICRKIVEHHGGRIWVEPAETGSRFVISLPKSQGS